MPNRNKVIIAVDYPIFPERIGGMDRFFWLLEDKLKQEGIDAVWIFPESKDDSHYQVRGFNLRVFPKINFMKDITSFLQEERGAKVIVTHFLPYNTVYPWRWKKMGVRKIIAVDHMSRPRFARSFSYKIKYFLKGLINYLAIDQIIAVSSFVKVCIRQEMGFWWQLKTKVIYNGVDLNIFRPSLEQWEKREGQILIFSIAHLIEDKGIQILIQAIALLHTSIQEKVRVVIAGDGSYRTHLEQLVARQKLSKYIQFIGNTSNQEVWLQQSDIVIIPSLWREAFGLTIAEALACGALVLASQIGAIPEIAKQQQQVRLFPPGNSQYLKEILEHYIKSIRLIKRNNNTLLCQKKYEVSLMVENHWQQIKKSIYK